MIVLWAILIISLSYILWKRRDLYLLSWKLSGPLALPLFGNILSLWNENENINYLNYLAENYESPTRVWMGPELYLFVHDAKTAEAVLKARQCLNKPAVYNAVTDALGADGLFTLKSDKWRLHRRLISPTLKESTVFGHLSIFNKFVRGLVLELKEELRKPAFNILEPLNVCTLSMFLDAVIGMEWHYKTKYTEYFNEALTAISKRLYRPWFQIEWIWKLTKYVERLSKYQRFSNDILDNIIRKASSTNSEAPSFVEKLIEVSKENEHFTIDNIKAETHTLLAGASDTMSVSLASVLLMLAMHPKHQETVYKELLDIMPVKEVDLTAEKLNELQFLHLCMQESFRLLPTVPLIARCSSEAIKINGIQIPANVPIAIGIKQIQMRKEYWGPDAKLFNPYRFEGYEKNKLKENCAYIPFSYGPRNCPGYTYAIYTMKLVLAHIIRNYRLSTRLQMADLKIRLSISYRLLNKHMIQLHERIE